MVRWTVALIGLGSVSGCESHYGPCSGSNAPAEGVVDVSSDVPIFDWEFGTAYALSVYELDGDELGREMWHIQCGGDNLAQDGRLESQVCIETPIAYGEQPTSEFLDTVNLTGPAPLVPGARYQVVLSTMIEDDGPELEDDGPDWLDFLEGADDGSCGSAFSADVEFVAPGDPPGKDAPDAG